MIKPKQSKQLFNDPRELLRAFYLGSFLGIAKFLKANLSNRFAQETALEALLHVAAEYERLRDELFPE